MNHFELQPKNGVDKHFSVDNQNDYANELFKSFLKFTSINANDVGQYCCVYKDLVDETENYFDEIKHFSLSSIYVFVNGNTNSIQNKINK